VPRQLPDPPGPRAGTRSPVQFGGGSWESQPQDWARAIEPRPVVDPAVGVSRPWLGLSSGQKGLSQALAAGELAGAGAALGLAGAALSGGKLGDVGGQGMSPAPGPESSPDEWANPFAGGAPGAGAPAPTSTSKPPSSPSSSSSSSPPVAAIALGGALLLLLLLA